MTNYPLAYEIYFISTHAYTIIEVFCEEITLDHGIISFSSQDYIFGSVATHTCNAEYGYVLSDPNITTRTCLLDGWSAEITCQC